MSSLGFDIENAMRRLDASKASRLERLLRDALFLVTAEDVRSTASGPAQHLAWLQRLDRLRSSVGTGKNSTSTEDILDDLRSERG